MVDAKQTQGLFLNSKQVQEFFHLLRDKASVIGIRKIDPVFIDDLHFHVLPFSPAYGADVVAYSFSKLPSVEHI